MFILFFSIGGSIVYWYQNGTQEDIQIKIRDKQRITSGSKSKYMIFTKNESFENTDSFFHSKYNSSDLYSSLKKGCSYEVSVYGWRVPFFSAYRNIVKIKKEDPCQ